MGFVDKSWLKTDSSLHSAGCIPTSPICSLWVRSFLERMTEFSNADSRAMVLTPGGMDMGSEAVFKLQVLRRTFPKHLRAQSREASPGAWRHFQGIPFGLMKFY